MKNSPTVLSPTCYSILYSLAKFRFLTIGLMQELGIMKDRSNLHKSIRKLFDISPQLIDRISYPLVPKRGRFEDFYFLTYKGFELLQAQREIDVIKHVKKASSIHFHNDYMHRKHSISALIAINKSYGDFEVMDSYFDQAVKGSDGQFKPATYLSFDSTTSKQKGISPDALFRLLLENDSGQIQQNGYALELINGLSFTRNVAMLKNYLSVHQQGLINDRLSISDKGCPVLLVFEEQRLLERIFTFIYHDTEFEHFRAHFWLISLKTLVDPELPSEWIDGNGTIKTIGG